VTYALWREGLVGAAVMLLNVLLSATAATAWYEWLVGLAAKWFPSYDYLLDFTCLWGLFCVLLLVMREATDRVSRTRIKVRRPVELAAAPLVAALAAWVMVCFTAASLHTAAVPRDFVQRTPETRMFFGLAPDRRWLQWVRGATLSGPFAAAPAKAEAARADPAFDRHADFILRYAARRQTLESQPALRVQPK
jgi:hypothetical protein